MRLHDLFEDEEGGVVQELRDAILDLLTPLAAQGIPKVSIQAIIDKMRDVHSGVAIDRALVMHVLDPQDVKMVTKIEGDTLYFNLSDENSRAVSDDEKEKEADKMKTTAVNQAKKSIKDKSPAPSKAPAAAPAKPAPAAAPAAAPAPAASGGI
jgi:hypothetical protein